MMSGIAKIGMQVFALIIGCTLFVSCTSELDQQMEACQEAFPAYAEAMSDIQAEWDDTFDIAASTSRIALAGPVADLQNIRREANKLTPPVCIADSHESYLDGMDAFIELLLDFMADVDTESDESEVMLAQVEMLRLTFALEQYKQDPAGFFEEMRGVAATATAESAE